MGTDEAIPDEARGGQRTVLVVDDDAIIRDVVVRYLEREGFKTLQAGDGLTARDLIEGNERELALVVLDLMLPAIDGLELCRWIRSRGELPVIMLTARSDETDRIVGLELGADDYVGKPFSPRELTARVRSVLRRSRRAPEPAGGGPAGGARLQFGEMELDPVAHRVTRAGRELRLTAREFDLLEFFARNPGAVFSRDQLMARVWGYETGFDTGTVSVHVRRLREKIETDPSEPRHLQTVWGVGYRFTP
ncbi:MAG: response regulator transcription factor [Actinobacteria bacterium]|nr:response regulator transcription factor [Actinomycetota bacterium]